MMAGDGVMGDSRGRKGVGSAGEGRGVEEVGNQSTTERGERERRTGL